MNVAILPLILIGLLFMIVPLVALVMLQVYLSKMEKDWPGLVLPILYGAFSILISLIVLVIAIRGRAIFSSVIGITLINIPTVVFTLIYFNIHKKAPKNEIDKMTIQDLG